MTVSHPGHMTAQENNDIRVVQDQHWILIGPNGVGKTHLLRQYAGLTKGTPRLLWAYLLSPIASTSATTKPYLMQQEGGLFSHLRVQEMLKCVAATSGMTDTLYNEITLDLRITQLMSRRISQLSVGEYKRVALCVALVACVPCARPLLLDEPFNHLDATTRSEFLNVLTKRCNTIPIILVTHDDSVVTALRWPVHTLTFGH